jgi:hypothetical protein
VSRATERGAFAHAPAPRRLDMHPRSAIVVRSPIRTKFEAAAHGSVPFCVRRCVLPAGGTVFDHAAMSRGFYPFRPAALRQAGEASSPPTPDPTIRARGIFISRLQILIGQRPAEQRLTEHQPFYSRPQERGNGCAGAKGLLFMGGKRRSLPCHHHGSPRPSLRPQDKGVRLFDPFLRGR